MALIRSNKEKRRFQTGEPGRRRLFLRVVKIIFVCYSDSYTAVGNGEDSNHGKIIL